MLKLFCKICSTLTPSDTEIVEQMSNVATILSNILEMDVFLDCPTKKEDEAMVVFHARPEKKSLYSKNISGEIAYRINEPAVFRTFSTGLASRNYKAITQENEQVLQNILPIFNSLDEVICVIIIEYSEKQKEIFDKEYNKKAAAILMGQIDSLKDRVTEYINDAIITFNKDGYATYANKVAKILYENLGKHNIIGESFENLYFERINYNSILENPDSYKMKEINILNYSLSVQCFVSKINENIKRVTLIIKDITEEKKHAEELRLKTIFIKEIHHRVKNNLQTIASLLRLQKRRIKNEEVKKILDETINRILSIAITHEVLSTTGIDQISIKPILDILYGNYFKNNIDKTKKIEFNIYGDEFFISSDKATSVALVVNEIIQNAIDHAFIGRDKGKIEIEIIKNQESSKIRISDNGVGMDLSKNENNMGFLIVNSLIKDKLKGNIDVKSAKGIGTTIEFDFKN
ncbi:MAG: sensor histidine kinase [Fusobacterium gastrosuis]|uniref:sensor histidine kinase n=1 Tax=Fusobacterium gastrosuis TaxID=1755100 RepID=UPI002A9EA708|nr:sensor histidine kinase [Fusobacteriaceae bacterium]MDY5794340.1 sensor histidine kinase [Fusobacterium gastrosuis]